LCFSNYEVGRRGWDASVPLRFFFFLIEMVSNIRDGRA